ncbi:MAG: CHC2 zinc finger domain-containing protein, partial [Acidobacteria bacterium]|nr:CHC2 zinc finger domain-containing protein [Acidobacteriota bacterium]
MGRAATVDTADLRRRATVGLLRSEIAARAPCPGAGGRCGCAQPRGNLHCPVPAHNDTTPSVSADTKDGGAVWYCHGCDHGGDLVTLLEAADGLSRGDALRAAAALAGADADVSDALGAARARRMAPPRPDSAATTVDGASDTHTLAVVWDAAGPCTDTPAALYAAGRGVWPAADPIPNALGRPAVTPAGVPRARGATLRRP